MSKLKDEIYSRIITGDLFHTVQKRKHFFVH